MDLPFLNKPKPRLPSKQQLASLDSEIQAAKLRVNTMEEQLINLESLLSIIEEGIIILDSGFKVIFVNQKAVQMVGLSPEALTNYKVADKLKFFDKDTELTILHICPLQKDKSQAEIFSRKGLKVVGGKKITVDLITKQFEGKSGQIYFALIIKDTTSQSELENMKMDFVSMAAHELRTPLTSINGYMSVFLSENKDKLNADQRHLLDRVVMATEQLRVLVENLLNASKIEKGVLNVNFEVADFVFTIQETIDAFKQRAVEKNIEFEFENKSSVNPKLRLDKVRINEVVANLISNAIKYTDFGGKIKLWIEVADNQLITHVTDTGKGISPEVLPTLFNKFVRGGEALDQSAIKGSGLGLYIAKSIVEMHHGKIWAESELGKGSTFSFSLPL